MLMFIIALTACSGGDKESGEDALVGDSASGATLYAAACEGCHGADGTLGTDIGGTASADLSVRVPAMEDDDIADQIENGGSAMPAQYDDPQDIADVIAYLRATFG